MCTGGRSKWWGSCGGSTVALRSSTWPAQAPAGVPSSGWQVQVTASKQQLRDSFNGTHSSESFSHSGTHSQLPWLVPVVLIAMRFPKQRYLALLPRCQLGCQPAGIFTLPRCQPIDLASWLTFERGPSIYLLQQLTLLLHSLPMHSRMIHAFC